MGRIDIHGKIKEERESVKTHAEWGTKSEFYGIEESRRQKWGSRRKEDSWRCWRK